MKRELREERERRRRERGGGKRDGKKGRVSGWVGERGEGRRE